MASKVNWPPGPGEAGGQTTTPGEMLGICAPNPPGTTSDRETIKNSVIQIIAEMQSRDPREIQLGHLLGKDLGVKSNGLRDLLEKINAQFNVGVAEHSFEAPCDLTVNEVVSELTKRRADSR